MDLGLRSLYLDGTLPDEGTKELITLFCNVLVPEAIKAGLVSQGTSAQALVDYWLPRSTPEIVEENPAALIATVGICLSTMRPAESPDDLRLQREFDRLIQYLRGFCEGYVEGRQIGVRAARVKLKRKGQSARERVRKEASKHYGKGAKKEHVANDIAPVVGLEPSYVRKLLSKLFPKDDWA